MGPEPLPLDPAAIDALAAVSTATITTVLLKKGLRNVWLRGTRPLASGQPRVVGRAFTLRFVSAREDLATPASWAAPISIRAASGIMREVARGVPLPGLYPANEAPTARYRAWVADSAKGTR